MITPAIQGSTSEPIYINWTYLADDGVTEVAQDLTGCTLTGKIKLQDDTLQSITGVLSIVSPATGGIVKWVLSGVDVQVAGLHQVQLTALDEDDLNKRHFVATWPVHKSL